MNWIIILAGGSGSRVGKKINKVFLKLKDRAVIEWSILKAEKSNIIDKILISVKKEDFKKIEKIISKNNFKKIEKVLVFEGSRQERIENSVDYLKNKAQDEDLIGFHNGANPLFHPEELEEVYKAGEKYGASLLAMRVTDTIKISDKKGLVVDSPTRDYCFAAQTPQVAKYKFYKMAIKKAKKNKFEGTDDAQLIARIGIKPKIIECSKNNFKITYLEDLQRAKKII